MGNPRLRAPYVCPLCGSEDYQAVYVTDSQGRQRRTEAYQCRRCTVMFRDPERFSAKREVLGILLDE
jgi:hypothetical protein